MRLLFRCREREVLMTMIVSRWRNWRRSSNAVGGRAWLVAFGLAWAAGCTSEEPAQPPEEVTVAAVASVPPRPPASDAFVEFESGQTRPLALSADGRFLYAANT